MEDQDTLEQTRAAPQDRPDGFAASEGDDRTRNNSGGDAVRHDYRLLSDGEKKDMVAIKDLGALFLGRIDELAGKAPVDGSEWPGRGRCYSLARTKVEEAVMWAVKGLTA